MTFAWAYYDLVNGQLRDERGRVATFRVNGVVVRPMFASHAEAEQFLSDNDIRGNVR